MSVDILFLAFNRFAYTKVAWQLLLANTDWDRADRLVVYDDGSEDGTRDWLIDQCRDLDLDVEVVLRLSKFGSPVQVMHDHFTKTPADLVAKVDNDIAVGPGWLPTMLAVMQDETVDALGMASGWTGTTGGEPGWQSASHIGGVGVIRTSSLIIRSLQGNGRYGWTEYQHNHDGFRSGWVTPDVLATQMDLIPDDPWPTLRDRYVEQGWARHWPPYDSRNRHWWDWIPNPNGAAE